MGRTITYLRIKENQLCRKGDMYFESWGDQREPGVEEWCQEVQSDEEMVRGRVHPSIISPCSAD